MRLTLIASAVTLALASLAQPALAQEAPRAPYTNGVGVTEARNWLISVGGDVSEPVVEDDASTLMVNDQLPWRLSLRDCNGLCFDGQFTAAYSGPGVTQEWVNQWNRERRFLKAYYVAPEVAGGEGSVIVQYDLLFTGTGTQQLLEATALWKQMQGLFVTSLWNVTPGVEPAGS